MGKQMDRGPAMPSLPGFIDQSLPVINPDGEL